MRIALINFEFPPDRAFGGIATYASQLCALLVQRGHDVEVFASTAGRPRTDDLRGARVHWIQSQYHDELSEQAAAVFAQVHRTQPFDVLECPEYGADGWGTIRLVPELPLLVRLHTPRVLVEALDRFGSKDVNGWRAALRGYNCREDLEWHFTRQADVVSAPTQAVLNEVAQLWGLDRQRMRLVPPAFESPSELLSLSTSGAGQVVTCVGRLEQRKGVLTLGEAIPMVLAELPTAKFRIVGRATASPEPGVDMRSYLAARLAPWGKSVELPGPLPPKDIPDLLASTDVCVFPSLWESLGFVCLEAMAAGRAIVASSVGGLAELVADGDRGLLVSPGDPKALARAILDLLRDPAKRERCGRQARAWVVESFSPQIAVSAAEASYLEAIERRRAAGRRWAIGSSLEGS